MVLWNVNYTHDDLKEGERVLTLIPVGKRDEALKRLFKKHPGCKLERVSYGYPGKLNFCK